MYAPQLLRGFIDGVMAHRAAEQLAAVAALFLGVAAGRQVSRGLAAYLSESVAWSATNRLRSDLLRHTVGLDLSFVNRHAPGVMLERIDGDSNQLATFFSQFSLRLLRGVLLLAGILVALLIEDWRLCLALLGFVAAVTFILVKLRSFGVPYHERLREAAANLHGFVEERLAGIEDLKALGGLVDALRRMTALIAVQVRRARRAYSLGTLVWPVVNVVMGIGSGLILAWGGVLVLRGEMTMGTVPFAGDSRPHRERQDHGDAAVGAALRSGRRPRHAERRGPAAIPAVGPARRGLRGDPGGAVFPRLHPRQPVPVRLHDRRSAPGGGL